MHDNHFNIKKVSRLEDENRIRQLRPRELLETVAGVREGMTCIDLGCGTGVFSIPMAEIAGNNGKVYGVDDSPELLDYLREKNPPASLVLVQSDVRDSGLESGIADFCLLAFILHEVSNPETLLSEAYRLLKPGGTLTVVEWRADSDGGGPPKSIRLTRQRIEHLFIQRKINSFKYTNWTDNHYIATGSK